MQKTKNSTQTAVSSVRPVTITSNFRNQKVETLNQLVQEIGQTRKETVQSELQSIPASVPENRIGMGEQVLKVLKQRIKTNYDQLYSNYPQNKGKIFKQIQTVETNINGENAMNSKYQQVIKQKSKFDKIKIQVQQKQRKLKKLVDLRTQLKNTNENDQSESNKEQIDKLQQMEGKKQEIQHNNLIYAEMNKQRKNILLNLDKRQKFMQKELQQAKQRSQKWEVNFKKKKQDLRKLNHILSKEETIQIPQGLAQSLSNKLQQYQNKHSYNNIIHHQAILQEQKFQQIKQETNQRKEEQRLSKLRKDKEAKTELQQLHNINALNNMEQYKIKRAFGAQSIQEVLNGDQQKQQENLDKISKQIEQEIIIYEQTNQKIQEQIEKLVSTQKQDSCQKLSYNQLTHHLEEQRKRKKLLFSQLQKKRAFANHWQTIMHIINNNQLSKKDLQQFTMNALNREQTQSVASKNGSINVQFPPSCRSSNAESIDFQ